MYRDMIRGDIVSGAGSKDRMHEEERERIKAKKQRMACVADSLTRPFAYLGSPVFVDTGG